jgi:hypothetical protein
MSTAPSIFREAYLTFEGEPLECIFEKYRSIINYISSETRGLKIRASMSVNPDGTWNGSLRVYPLGDAEEVLDLSEKISDAIRQPVEFSMRPMTGKN